METKLSPLVGFIRIDDFGLLQTSLQTPQPPHVLVGELGEHPAAGGASPEQPCEESGRALGGLVGEEEGECLPAGRDLTVSLALAWRTPPFR